ncbi:hypothetical protein JCM24511_08966 [Saitozyma sp. JCM 24511]|nr:hypothetical protein JCM24511_08966 [Saitozyma sp. JCM 24511]
MSTVLSKGNTAVITGGAQGIGLAAGVFFAEHGMNVVLVDWKAEQLKSGVETVKAVDGVGKVLGFDMDLSVIDNVESLRDQVLKEFPEVHVVMSNHAIINWAKSFSTTFSLRELQAQWAEIMGINFNSVIMVAQAFAPSMSQQKSDSVIITSGSKLGVDNRPGKPGYNSSKAAMKHYTEQREFAHELRNTPGCRCTAHHFIPGWTWSGLTSASNPGKINPLMWTARQTVEYMVDKIFVKRSFYAVCPDNECSEARDRAEEAWTANDIIEKRPALSRWHPDYADKFKAYLKAEEEAAAAQTKPVPN